MTATSERVSFITQEFRTSVASDPAVKAKYGETARDTGDEPVETFFDDPADGAAMAAERLSLLKADRRRFSHDVAGILSFTGAMGFSQTTPTVTVVDDERAANHLAAVVEIGIRYDDNRTTLVTWG